MLSPPSFIQSSEHSTEVSAPQSIPSQDLLYSPLNRLTFIVAASGTSRKENYFATQWKEGETVKSAVNLKLKTASILQIEIAQNIMCCTQEIKHNLRVHGLVILYSQLGNKTSLTKAPASILCLQIVHFWRSLIFVYCTCMWVTETMYTYSFMFITLSGTYTKTEIQVYINKAQMFIFPPILFNPTWLVLNRTQSLKNYPRNCNDTSKRRKTAKLIAAISFNHYNNKSILAAVWECHHMTEQRNTLQGKQDTGMQLVICINFLVQGNLL